MEAADSVDALNSNRAPLLTGAREAAHDYPHMARHASSELNVRVLGGQNEDYATSHCDVGGGKADGRAGQAVQLITSDEGHSRALLAGADAEEGVDLVMLLQQGQNNVLDFLEQMGVRKLGEMQVVDRVIIQTMGEQSMLTTGSKYMMHQGLDWQHMWRQQLCSKCKHDDTTDASLCTTRTHRSPCAPHAPGFPAGQHWSLAIAPMQLPMCRFNAAGWNKKVAVEAYVVTIRGCVLPGPTGLLHPLLQHYRAGSCSRAVFGLPAVQAIINFKWEHFARTLLLWQMVLFTGWLACVTAFVLMYRDEDIHRSLWQLLHCPYGRAEVAVELLALLFMLPFVLLEATNIAAYRWRWFGVEKLLSAGAYVNQVAITCVHLTRLGSGTEVMDALLALQYILLWFRFQASFRVFRPTSTTFADTLKEVVSEIKWYIVFLGVTVWAFAVAFHVLLRFDVSEEQEDYNVMSSSFMATLNMVASGTEWKPFYTSDSSLAASCLFVLFVITMPLILLTQFISLMTLTMSKMREQEGLRFLMHKAMTIDELETGIPTWLLKALPITWFPAFVHVLKVNPRSVHTMSLDEGWTNLGLNGDASIIDPTEEMRVRLKRVEQLLVQVSQQMNQLSAEQGHVGNKIKAHDADAMPLDVYE